jgi:hypothetical protein
MPTGYTSIIEEGDGCTFEQYLIRCVNAFVRGYDENGFYTEIPQRVTSSGAAYNDERLREDMQALRELEVMTLEERIRAAVAANAEAQERHREWIARQTTLRERYTKMQEQVEQWHPPTPAHQELRNFMLQQLSESCRWDFMNSPAPKPRTAADWYNTKRAGLLKSIGYHTTELAKGCEWEAKMATWLRDLRKSLYKDEEVEP